MNSIRTRYRRLTTRAAHKRGHATDFEYLLCRLYQEHSVETARRIRKELEGKVAAVPEDVAQAFIAGLMKMERGTIATLYSQPSHK